MSKEQLSCLIQAALSAKKSHPYDMSRYEKAMQYAYENSLQDCAAVFRLRFQFEPLSANVVENWERAIDSEYAGPEALAEKCAMYGLVKSSYPTASNTSKWLELATPDDAVLRTAYSKCQTDFVDSYLVFDKLLACLCLREDWFAARAVYEARLEIPHMQLQDTFGAFSAFVSTHFASEYTAIMRAASRTMKNTERSQRYYEQLEQAVQSAPQSSQPWLDYLNQVFEYGDKKYLCSMLCNIFYRSVWAASNMEDKWRDTWREVWHRMSYFFANSLFSTADMCHIISLHMQNCPSDPRAYSEEAWKIASENRLGDLRERIKKEGIFESGEAGYEVLAKDLLTVEYAVCPSSPSLLENLKNTCGVFLASHDVVAFCIKMLERLPDPRAPITTKHVLKKYLDRWNSSSSVCISALEAYDRAGLKEEYHDLLREMVTNVSKFDKPRAVFAKVDTCWRLEREDGYLSDLQKRIAKFESKVHDEEIRREEIEARMREEKEETEENTRPKDQNSATASSKAKPARTRDGDTFEDPESKRTKSKQSSDTDPVRSREQFRVKLYPLSAEATEEDIADFLHGYADPLSMTIGENHSERFAIVELASEQEVLSCLTRQYKTLLGLSVNIQRLFGTTVWATNYPSSYDQHDIENMISEHTGIHPVAVRLPSQRDHKERRFFYADFADESTALTVRDTLSGLVLEGHIVQAEISNPTLKRPRDVAPASRQIHLHNLNFKKTTEDCLRQYFSKWGNVVSVHLPLSEANKSKGFLNSGFAFITFSTDASASEALAQKSASIDDREVDISAVKPKKPRDKKSAGFDDEKSVTIHNVSDTVTEAQLVRFLEEKVGAVTQVSLKPSRKLALVELHTVKDAGKVGVALEGVEYHDHILHVGPKKDFFQEESVKVPSMVPPMLMRRRRKKN